MDAYLEQVRSSRLEGLETHVFYYEDMVNEGRKLNDKQRKQLREVAETVVVFGEYGQWLHDFAEEILSS